VLLVLGFENGNIVCKGGPIPYGKFDSKIDSYKAPAYRYGEILKHLTSNEVEYRDEVFEGLKCPKLTSGIELRDYQEEALDAWRNAGHLGLIVLPTGAGKTVIAMKAIEILRKATLIVVPTLVLLNQWKSRLEEDFGIKVGAVGGGSRQVRAVTVATYDSASLRAERMGNLFYLIIFDEAHHLPAESYRQIGLKYIAPHRMGLTATLAKDDDSRISLKELVGDVVYEMEVDDLAGIHLADYTVQTIPVPLSPDEQQEYDGGFSIYRGFLRSRGIKIRSARDYQRFVMRTGRDPEARRALLARNRAMDLALNSSTKVEYLKQLLKKNPEEKTIIFTRHNKLVYRISSEMLLPAITHQTPKEEREEILRRFRQGMYRRIVTSEVLDEGVDVPDASMAVILSGTGSSRQFVQRLGRVLRKREGKQAKLVELVSQGTAETRISRRRKRE
jgi:superfamily II DNA or RNA helicase